MATSSKLEAILGEEFSSLKPEIAKKLEEYIFNKDKDVDELQNQIKHLSASTEQHNFQLEKELLSNQNKLSETIQTLDNLRVQLTDLDEKFQVEKKKNDDLRENHQKAVDELQKLQGIVSTLNNEKLQLSNLLGKKELENQKLNDEIKILQKEVAKVISSKHEFMAKSEDLEIKVLNIQHQNRKLETEKGLLQQQISSINDDISQKSREILQLRKEKSSTVLELQAELDEKTETARLAQEHVNTLKKQVLEKDKKLYDFAVKLKESQENALSMEQTFNQELQALTRLRDLHKKNSEDNQSKITELVKTIEDMHKLLKETGEANNELEKSFGDTQVEWRNKLEEKDDEIESLKRELHNINDLLAKSKVLGFSEEGVESLFPTAAATSKILKSEMTLTEIYSELVKAQSELQTEKYEKQRLRQQLKQILDEIGEKTPLFNKKLSEYQNALETITCLRNQLTDSLTDQERLQSERDEAVRKVQYHIREGERMKSLLSDLSLQVRNLLREVEEARGGRVVEEMDQQAEIGDADASSVITRHLVTFKDIKDLQEKNEQLLVVVRDLGQQLEENDKLNADSVMAEMKEKLDVAQKQLEELKEERKHQSILVESVVRQKDLYKSMISQQSMAQSLEASFTSSTPKGAGYSFQRSRDDNKLNLDETHGALKQLQDEFDNYRKEKQRDYATLSEQLDKFREELSEARIQNAKLTSELDYIREKCELAQSKADSFEKEVSIFREKSRQYSSSSIQHQQTINSLRQDLISMREKLAKSENTVQNLQAERELLKSTEIRILQEKEAAIREQNSNARVISNLQAVQNNLERMESEAKLSMQKRIENLEQEISVYKNKLEREAERYQAAVKAWDEKNEDMRNKMLVEVGKSNKTHEELVEAYSQLHQTKLELSTIQSKFSAAQTKLSRMPVGGGGDSRGVTNEMKTLQTLLNETRNENNDLKHKLEESQKSLEKYRRIADQLERHMKEESEAAKQREESLQKSLKEKEEEVKRLENILKEAELQNNNLKEEMAKLTHERDQLIENIDTMKRELDKSLSLVKQAKKIEQDAQHDKQEQSRLVAEAQEHYQRELMLHSADVQELTTLRDQVQGIRNELMAAVEERDRLKATIIANQESCEERERLVKKESELMSQKCRDIQAQNDALYQQLEVMSSQLATIKSSDWGNNDEKSSENSPDHLMEVIRYLRKEKEIAHSQNETSVAECGRFKMKTEILERRIAEAEKELKEERDRSNLVAASENQHQELLKKVEMLNLLQESNKLIRDEKDAAVSKNATLEAQVKQLETQLSPLQKNLQDSISQMDVVNAECVALRQEVKKWQNRAAQLLEQSRKHDPEDFKKLQEENLTMKTQINASNEEKQRLKAELSKQTLTLSELQKEFSSLQETNQRDKANVARLEAESSEHQRTTIQVKKIARKYKTEYTDLKTQYDDMATKLNTSGENTAAQAAKEQQFRLEMQNEYETKAKEANDKAIKATEELERLKEEVSKLTKSDENAKTQEERLRRLLLQMKKKVAQVTTERDNALREKTDKEKVFDEVKTKLTTLEQNTEEENLRASTFKSQYEAKITKMEKEMRSLKENKERLEKQVEELSRLKQSSRPSTSAGLVERASSTISEPPLIRPLTPPMVSSVRHPSHSLQTSTTARSTPTASIRPMAIGSSTSTNVVASHASSSRTATVTPTSAIPSSEADNVPITMAHVLPQSVPQATVQPTPANIATVTIAPSSNELVSEVASSVSDSADTMFVSAVPRFRQAEIPSTQDDSRGGPSEAEDSCSSSVVSVSVVSTSPQTQVVTPTVKRPREELEPQSSVITRETDSPDTTGASSSSPQVKRIRIVGDTTLTVERASVVTSGAHQMESTPSTVAQSSKTSQEEVMPERPGVIVTPEPQTTPITAETSSNTTAQESAVVLSDTVHVDVHYINSQQLADDEQTETKPKTSGELSEADESKKNYAEEEYIEEDEGEVEEGMEDEGPDYEDEEPMQDPQEEVDDDDDMIGIDDTEGNSDEAEIGDDMDADGPSNSCHSTVVGDNVPTSTQQDIPSAMVTGSTSTASSAIMTTNVGTTTLSSVVESQDVVVTGTSTHHRPAILPRVPPRPERVPSVGRQHLTPFSIPGQSGTFEEGDDSIVPSTPTLFVQGRADGFAEAVSSPQVPQGRFVFTNESGNQTGICQLATQGALGVDDTRMDLSQFDEGSGRSVPTTPLQVSPPADAPGSGELVESVSVSQSQTSQLTDQQVTSTRTIPTIMVNTPSEDVTSEETTEKEIEETSLTIEEIKEEVSASETVTEGAVDDGESGASQSMPLVESEDISGDVSGDSVSNKSQPQRKPITWDGSKGAGGPSGPGPSSTTAPVSTGGPPLLPFPSHPPPRARSIDNSQRGRRVRIRGSGTYSPRGGGGQRGNWPNYWRGRGRGGPPMS